MAGNTTTHLIDMYVDEATPVPYLTSKFRAPPKNYYTSQKVELDIVRDTEEVAIVIQDLSAGSRENEMTLYQNKGFVPPVYDEAATLSAIDMMQRFPGQDVFSDPDYAANATEWAFTIFRKLENKIRRAVELQAAQVLQTGKLNLTDKSGRPLYVLDYGPRTTHFVTAGTAWGSNGANPMGDIGLLADVVRRDGRGVPNELIFGKRSWRDFIADATVKAAFNLWRMSFGMIQPTGAKTSGGVSFKGRINIDNYDYDIYVYDGTYVDPQTGNTLNYVSQDSVIMLSDNSRLDLTFGAIPKLKAPDSPAMAFLPPRISNGDVRIDLSVFAWFTPDGKHLKLSAGTRPLAIPTAIDTFGCLTTR
jgi:hypothetical protein